VKLEMLIALRTCYRRPRVVTERNSRIYPASTLASKFARSDSSW